MTDPIDWEQVEADAVSLLQGYLRIDTSNPPGHELAAAEYLRQALARFGIDARLGHAAPDRANLLARVPADTPTAPPLVLTHHMDVVTADPAAWSSDPYGANERDGFIYGRGTLDTKALGIIHLLGLGLFVQQALPRTRDILFLAVCDEEAISAAGTRWVLQHWREELAGATIWNEGGFAVRGILGQAAVVEIATAEKLSLTLKLVAHGRPGHGAAPHADNANDILVRALGRVTAWRQPREMTPDVAHMLCELGSAVGGVQGWVMRHSHWPLVRRWGQQAIRDQLDLATMLCNTISVTIVHGGEKDNVIPGTAYAILDARLLPHHCPDQFCQQLAQVIDDTRITIEIIDPAAPAPASPLDNPLFTTLAAVMARRVPGAIVTPIQMSGVSDGRWFRQAGLPTYGLAPIVVDEADLVGIHGSDERISRANMRLGTQVVYEVLREMGGGDRGWGSGIGG